MSQIRKTCDFLDMFTSLIMECVLKDLYPLVFNFKDKIVNKDQSLTFLQVPSFQMIQFTGNWCPAPTSKNMMKSCQCSKSLW